MSDSFNPSIEATKAAMGNKTPIVTNAHPTGAKGAAASLKEVAERILRGRNDPRVNGWAGRALTHKAGCPFIPTGKHDKCNCRGGYDRKSTRDQGQAVLDAMRAQTQYVQDPVNTEMMKQPAQTLCLDEHGLCMPAGDCDDRCITFGSAMMSLGVPVKVVGQAFESGSKVPTHVIVAIQDTKDGQWYRVDPSSKYDVGGYFPATHEDWIDPLDTKPQAHGDFVGVGADAVGDFVGIGQVPSGVSSMPGDPNALVPDLVGNDIQELAFPYFEHFYPIHQMHDYRAFTPVGVGQTPTSEKTVVQQVEMAVYTLDKARNDLRSAVSQITTARNLMGTPFDPEPSYAVTDLSTFPSDGSWTQSMATICGQILDVSDTLVDAGRQALHGARQILLYANAPDAFISALSSDAWSIQAVSQTINDVIYGFFDSSGNAIGGFSASSGASIGTPQITEEATEARKSNGTLLGAPVGLGQVDPLTFLVGTAIVAVSVYYVYSKFCAAAETKAKEATNQAMLKCLTTILPNGQPACTPADVQAMSQALSQARVAEQDAKTRNDQADPFTSFFTQLVTGVKWVVVGGLVAGVAVVAFPVIEEGIHGMTASMRAKREASGG